MLWKCFHKKSIIFKRVAKYGYAFSYGAALSCGNTKQNIQRLATALCKKKTKKNISPKSKNKNIP